MTSPLAPLVTMNPAVLPPVSPVPDRVAILDTGAEMLGARMQILNRARVSVRLQTFIFTADETGYLVADKLMELVRRGVSVRVNVDEVLNLVPKTQMLLLEMSRAGVIIEGFDTSYLPILDTLTSRVAGFDTFSAANFRYHEKLFVVDAEDPVNGVAILGGTNIANEYFRLAGNTPIMQWHDKDVVLVGPTVATVARAFDENLAEARFQRLSPARLSSPFWTTVEQIKALASLPIIPLKRAKLDPALEEVVRQIAATPVNLNYETSVTMFVRSRPRHQETNIQRVYLDLIRNARREILIFNSYFVPVTEIQMGLVDAVRRGVKVRIVTNHAKLSDIPYVQMAGRRLFRGLLGATAQYENGEALTISEWGGDVLFQNGQGLNHAKYAVFDREIGIVGSYNLDPRSLYLNSESVLVFQSAKLAETLASQFDRDAAPEMSRRVKADDIDTEEDDEGFLDKMKQMFSASFTALL